MDYLDILFSGYYNPNIREFLSNHIYRAFKEAEKNNYEAEEFFCCCTKVIEALIDQLKDKLHEEKEGLHLLISLAKGRNIEFSGDSPNITHAERCDKLIEEYKRDLDSLDINKHSINLASITQGKYRDNMLYKDILYMQNAIQEAYRIAGAETKTSVEKLKDKKLNMNKGIFPFVSVLYPIDQQEKMDLTSHQFYIDAVEFYIREENKNRREQLIKDMTILIHYIKFHDEWFDAMRAWDRASPSIGIREIFHSTKPEPNLVKEFRIKVSDLLEKSKDYLDRKKEKQIERSEANRKKLEDSNNREKAIIDRLLKNEKSDPLEKFIDFIYHIETVELLEEQEEIEFHLETERLMEAATYEILLLKPEQIKPILIRINDEIQAKFMDYHNRYSDPSKIDFNNELAAFHYKQFLGYSFHTSSDITDTNVKLDQKTLISISCRLHSNAALLAELKKRILKVFPSVVDLQPIPDRWLDGMPLFPNGTVSQTAPAEENNKRAAEIKKSIKERINNINIKSGWRFIFNYETDFNEFTDLLTDFYMGYNYSLPKKIRLKKGTETVFLKEIRKTHKDFAKSKYLIGDEGFYEILRVLDLLKEYNNDKLYKKLIS